MRFIGMSSHGQTIERKLTKMLNSEHIHIITQKQNLAFNKKILENWLERKEASL